MSISYIPDPVRYRLWGKAAGRCQYDGCNEPLWLDSLTKHEFNIAYIAHIVADSPTGPRGHPELSEKLKADISNLMLLCDTHHRLIDIADVAGHPVDRLKAMKEAHEHRIEVTSAIATNRQSHVILYGANIGEHSSGLSYEKARLAMVPNWYPAESRPIALGMSNSSFEDKTPQFWKIEEANLRDKIVQQVRPRIAQGEIQHISIFAKAPQPLLILLGYLFSDILPAEVYQSHREPPGWRWQDGPDSFDFLIEEPAMVSGPPALVLSLSASVSNERIFNVLGPEIAIWRVTIPEPHNDFLKSQLQARRFREQMRLLFDRIKFRHGEKAVIHVFPVMPVALAIELGRVVMPKADLPLRIYDENKKIGGFVYALEIAHTERVGGI